MRTGQNTRTLIQIAALISLATIVGVSLHEKHPGLATATTQKGARSKFEVITFDQSKSWPSAVLVPEFDQARVSVASLDGTVVHSWPLQVERARLLPNGNLLTVRFRTDEEKRTRTGIYPLLVREYNWEGDLVWEFDPPGQPHHDVHRLGNGNTLVLWRGLLPVESKAAITDAVRRSRSIRNDVISEISPTGDSLWEWKAGDYLNLNSCGRVQCSSKVGTEKAEHEILDWLHTNTAAPLPENAWHKGGDTRFTPGNVVFLPRNWSTVFIIDKATKKLVWDYTGDYKGGLSLPHEAHMIEEGLPGAGNILLLDNGEQPEFHYQESYILEINPVTKKVVWAFDRGSKWYSRSAGSPQRLPNGNTFVSDDRGKRLFEVTPSGESVWHMKIGGEARRGTRIPYSYTPQLAKLDRDSEGNSGLIDRLKSFFQ